MIIAIVGTECSGRRTLQGILNRRKGFRVISCKQKAKVADDGALQFALASEMLNYVTSHWRDNFVTVDLTNTMELDPFAKRPFCLVVYIDAPLLLRYERYKRYYTSNRDADAVVPMELSEFVAHNDDIAFGRAQNPESNCLFGLRKLAQLEIQNNYGTITQLETRIEELSITDENRLRPQWDSYFMMLASLAAQRSNCMKRRVGAILVRNKRIVSTGYNGTPRGLANCNEGGCPRCNSAVASGSALEECLCLHAEENALLEAGRERVGEGSTLYCNTCPCLRCSVKIVQVGVKAVIYNLTYKVDDASAEVFRRAGVDLRRHEVPSPVFRTS